MGRLKRVSLLTCALLILTIVKKVSLLFFVLLICVFIMSIIINCTLFQEPKIDIEENTDIVLCGIEDTTYDCLRCTEKCSKGELRWED